MNSKFDITSKPSLFAIGLVGFIGISLGVSDLLTIGAIGQIAFGWMFAAALWVPFGLGVFTVRYVQNSPKRNGEKVMGTLLSITKDDFLLTHKVTVQDPSNPGVLYVSQPLGESIRLYAEAFNDKEMHEQVIATAPKIPVFIDRQNAAKYVVDVSILEEMNSRLQNS